MNELSAALRQFADSLDRGEGLAGATQCAIVLGTDTGATQATYIGRLIPANTAGVLLLAAGIQRFHMASSPEEAARTLTAGMFTNRGSTH